MQESKNMNIKCLIEILKEKKYVKLNKAVENHFRETLLKNIRY